MTNDIKIVETGNNIIITIDYKIKTSIKIYSIFITIFYIWFTIAGLIKITSEKVPAFIFIISLIVLAIFFLAGINHLKYFGYKEIIKISKTHLTLKENYFFYKAENKFFLKKIQNLQNSNYEEDLSHPINTGNFDAIGFETKQAEINNIVKSEMISFVYNKDLIEFGKTLYYTEAEEVINLILKRIEKA